MKICVILSMCITNKKGRLKIMNYYYTMKSLNALDWIALVLVIVGGLNWGLVGLFDFDLVATIFGDMSVLSRIVYILVGLSAVYMIVIAGALEKKGVAKADMATPSMPESPSEEM